MRAMSFRAELGINPDFNPETNGSETVSIEEIGAVLQKLQLEVETETGIAVTSVVSGPNRSCYRTDWGAPKGGEISYTVHGSNDWRLQLRDAPFADEDWKKAVLCLIDKLRAFFRQQYVPVEFFEQVDSFLFSPDCGLNEMKQEINMKMI